VKLVTGLGNPGAKYRGTRHNVGFEVVDLLAARHGLTFEAAPADALQAKWRRADDVVLLVKPLTFMNVSGQAVSALARYYKVGVDGTIVVCDDVNLPLGRLRIRASGTEGGHNGLRSIADAVRHGRLSAAEDRRRPRRHTARSGRPRAGQVRA
jgi:PTH1 family peptidyl-tRNA hydrolase